MQRENQKTGSGILLLIDAAALAVSFSASYGALKAGLHVIQPYTAETVQTYLTMLALSFLLAFFLQPASNGLLFGAFQRELGRIARYCLVMTMTFALLLFLIKSPMVDSRYLFFLTMLLNGAFVSLFHLLYKRLALRAYRRSDAVSLLGVVTGSADAAALIEDVKKDFSRRVAGVILLDGDAESVAGVPVIGDVTTLIECIRRDALDEVLFHVPYALLETMAGEIEEIKSMGTVVDLYVPLAENYGGGARTVDMIGNCPVVSVAAKRLDPSALAVKRLCDVVLSLIGLVISVPIIGVVAVPLLMESKGPLFFTQKRVGRNGRVFQIYKVRSMYQDAEQRKQALLNQNEMQGPMFKIAADPRITKVGRFIRKTSIDELPQLFNVLKGDMSLVGPRPPLVEEFTCYESRYKRRLSMRPGITGFWQVNGRNEVPDFEDVVRMDLNYIDNWSLRLDAWILFKTVGAVLSFSGR